MESQTPELKPKSGLSELEANLNQYDIRPAPIWLRLVAFMLDYVLITAILYMLLTLVLFPTFHPDYLRANQELTRTIIEMADTASSQEIIALYSDFVIEHEKAFNDAAFLLSVITWIYFALSELVLKGTTLGKKIFKLTSIDLKTLKQPNGTTILLRNCLKSLCVIMPLMLVINGIVIFFNRMRLAGHDMLSKTMVTYEHSLNQENPQRFE